MAFTQSEGLRDREYAKFEAVQTGSKIAVLVKPRDVVQTYTFEAADLIASATAGGSLDAFSSYPLNGMLKAVYLGESNYTGTAGSLFLNTSGTEITMWSMVSGTVRGYGVATSGATFPRGTTVYTWASPISGASQDTVLAEIPLADVYLHLVGSALGTSKSGTSIGVVYC